jgi:hypothetical protein
MYLTIICLVRGHFVDAVGKPHPLIASIFRANYYAIVGENLAAVLGVEIAQPRSMYSASPEILLKPEINGNKCNFSADCPNASLSF